MVVAILGFGVVGGGVYELLKQNASLIKSRAGETITIKYIVDVRDFSGHEAKKLIVNNIDPVLEDAQVDIVVEAIGGREPAFTYAKGALNAKKHYITSNKELVSQHGAELIALARKNGVCFLFEASVGAGTPIIAPIHQSMAANVISDIACIINGTTNYILTKMEREGLSFETALAEAQNLGFAEKPDPSADTKGIDAARKIAILASLAFGNHVYPDNVYTEGIEGVQLADIELAKELGGTIKLIAHAHSYIAGEVYAAVQPMFVPFGCPLSAVHDVYNAAMVRADMLGDVMFLGKGAGKLPTASGIVGEIIDCAKKGPSIHDTLHWAPSARFEGLLTTSEKSEYYVRVRCQTQKNCVEKIKLLFGGVTYVKQDADIAFTTAAMGEEEFAKKAEQLEVNGVKVLSKFKKLGIFTV